MYDYMHLAKSWRNNWLEGDYIIKSEDFESEKIVSFKDIEKVYHLDLEGKLCNALHLTEAHIRPTSFQKMNVRLALQIFSNSVAAAIRTSSDTGELKSVSAQDTADFVELLDKVFDILNSQELFCPNPYKHALYAKNRYAFDTLRRVQSLIPRISKISHKTGKISRPPCFDGLFQAIEATLQLFREEQGRTGLYLMTYNLNQDALENLFSIYRQKGGYNRNPTAKTLRTSFRSNAVNNLMQHSRKTNCLQDDCCFINFSEYNENQQNDNFGENLLTTDLVSSIANNNNDDEDSSIIDYQDSSNNAELLPDHPTLESCSIAYFAGYLAYKCFQLFNCPSCRNDLVSNNRLDNEHNLLLLHKTFSNISVKDVSAGLSTPSKELVKIVHECLHIFEIEFDKFYYELNVCKLILEKLVRRFDLTWLAQRPSCRDHKLFIVKHLVCKLFRKAKLISTKCHAHTTHKSDSKNNKNAGVTAKLRVLSHK